MGYIAAGTRVPPPSLRHRPNDGGASIILVDESRCPKNHPCPSIGLCPVDAIIQDDIFQAPRIDQERCISCGACTSACRAFVEVDEPVEALALTR